MEVRPSPSVSVVVDGSTETLELGRCSETLAGLRRQEFALGDVEVVLVGTAEQCREWAPLVADAAPFATVAAVDGGERTYHELKNLGADRARGPILAFLDSDTVPDPGWLAALVAAIDGGADATAGITRFRPRTGTSAPPALLAVISAVAWGFTIDGVRFVPHNHGVRADVFARHRFRPELGGRTCAGRELQLRQRTAGVRVAFVREQVVAHGFAPWMWLLSNHVRSGHETTKLRRLGLQPHSWVRRLGPLAPPLTLAWRSALDVPQYWRYANATGVPAVVRARRLPLLVAVSVAGRSAEALGAYASHLAPRAMARFAEKY
jgi:hypothetical protein